MSDCRLCFICFVMLWMLGVFYLYLGNCLTVAIRFFYNLYITSSEVVMLPRYLKFPAYSCLPLFYNVSTSVLVFLSFRVHSLPSSLPALLHLPLSFSLHVGPTNHLSLASLCQICSCMYFFCLDLLNPLYSHHLNIIGSVLCNKSCSAFLSVSLSM